MVHIPSIAGCAASLLMLLCANTIHAQEQNPSPSSSPSLSSPPPGTANDTNLATAMATVTPTATTTSATATAADIIIGKPTPSLATNPFEPGTVNCFDFPYCADGEECYVLSDGLVCLPRDLNYGYILARNESGVPSVPRWSGPKSAFNQTCSFMHVPDAPGLAMQVYKLIAHTIPKNLVLSHFDLNIPNWYTLFSNCEIDHACDSGTCQPRPKVGERCKSSWQCNPFALGLDETNRAVSTAYNNYNATNRGSLRCEYEFGEKSDNMFCQYLVQKEEHPNSAAGLNVDLLQGDSRTQFEAWHVLLPVSLVLLLIYGATVVYERRFRHKKLSKWRQAQQCARDEYVMETYDDIH